MIYEILRVGESPRIYGRFEIRKYIITYVFFCVCMHANIHIHVRMIGIVQIF